MCRLHWSLLAGQRDIIRTNSGEEKKIIAGRSHVPTGFLLINSMLHDIHPPKEKWSRMRLFTTMIIKTEALTLKVHLSVPVQVDVSQDLVDLAVVELLAHQLLHGLPQLSEADLAVAVRVELGRKGRQTNKTGYN